ncbi:acyltransferase [Mycobacteroides abscessus M94]|nr:acyltransferase [Mycobacteroides abscessus M94]
MDATPKPKGDKAFYRYDLDGLRGIAIFLVAVFHVWFGRVSGGVDVFLTLSGFFYGSKLLRTATTQGASLNPVPVVKRLVRRLLPALILVLAACAVLTVLVQPETRWETFAEQSLASLGYYQNWELANTAADYLAASESVSPLQHLWSMSVQGQFYVGFLALVYLLAVVLRKPLGRHIRTVLIVVIAVLSAASFGYAIYAHLDFQSIAYYNTFARAWELLLGVLVGALVAGTRWPIWLRQLLSFVAVVTILSCGALINGVREFPGPLALVPVVATLLLILSAANLPPDARQPAARRPTGSSPPARSSNWVRWPTRCTCGTGRYLSTGWSTPARPGSPSRRAPPSSAFPWRWPTSPTNTSRLPCVTRGSHPPRHRCGPGCGAPRWRWAPRSC